MCFVSSQMPASASYRYFRLVQIENTLLSLWLSGIKPLQNETSGASMKSERMPLRSAGWLLRCCLRVGSRCWLFGCWVVRATRPGSLSLSLSTLGLGKVFLDFLLCFFLCLATILKHFLALSFPQSECGPQAETPNTSHIWIYVMPLIGCCADAMVAPSAPPTSLSSSLARLPSISYEIEFGGGQRLKNTSGKVCAGLACCGMAG